jgi:hypothetical protein
VLCDAAVSRTLFHEEWWLDAASGGKVDRVEVRRDGVTIGSLSYVTRTRLGFVSLGMPRYTRTLGPIFNLPPAKPVQHAAAIRRITRELLEQMPRHDRFFQLLAPGDSSDLAFSLAGCTIYQAYTFRVQRDAEPGKIWDNVDGHVRRQVRAGRRALRCEQHTDLQRYIQVSLREHGAERNRHDFAAISRIFEACTTRGQAVILSVVSPGGADVACVVLVWGAGTLYYWLPAVDRTCGDSGANALLLWTAIEFAMANGLDFDSDSYRSGAAAKFFSGFGLSLARRAVVVRTRTIGRIYQAFVDMNAATAAVAPITHRPDGMPSRAIGHI